LNDFAATKKEKGNSELVDTKLSYGAETFRRPAFLSPHLLRSIEAVFCRVRILNAILVGTRI